MKELFVIALIAALLRVSMYQKEESNIVSANIVREISFQIDVLPIIQNRCSMCHNAGTPERNWLDYKTAYNKRASIKLRLENRTMPPNGIPILDTERELILNWIEQGAKK